MDNGLRTTDFRLGQFHGKIWAEKGNSEAQIQRNLFLSQKIKLWRTRKGPTVIRIFGYEVPLKKGCSRGECVDLLGYDEDRNLFLIELKKKDSTEKISDILNQLDGYANVVKTILPHIEEEFEKEYFFPMQFTAIKKIILAPRDFFRPRMKNLVPGAIEYAYFANKDITTKSDGETINIHLVRQ